MAGQVYPDNSIRLSMLARIDVCSSASCRTHLWFAFHPPCVQVDPSCNGLQRYSGLDGPRSRT
eukprot:52099-Amphidinium_carterae.1